MVSPIEGSVADINEAIVQNPELARKDPYGEGWLVTVQSPDAKTNFRNLLGGALARWWTEESASRLQRLMPTPARGARAGWRRGGRQSRPTRFPTRTGPRLQKSSSCRNGPRSDLLMEESAARKNGRPKSLSAEFAI